MIKGYIPILAIAFLDFYEAADTCGYYKLYADKVVRYCTFTQ